MRSDNGGEFVSKNFESVLIKNQIRHEYSAPFSPHQNGTAERSWRTLFDMARCILLESNLPKFLWTYSVKISAYIRNRCFNQRIGKTPYELFTNLKPNLQNMHIFGQKCFAYIQNKKKLGDRSEEGLFLGYDSNSPAFLIYFPLINQVKRIRCVKFSNNNKVEQTIDCDDVLIFRPNSDNTLSDSSQLSNKEIPKPENKYDLNINNDIDVNVPDGNDNDDRYPSGERKAPLYLNDYVTNLSDSMSLDVKEVSIDYCYKLNDIPKTYNQAIKSKNCDKWKAAMDKEIKSLEDNNTYNLVSRPKDKNIIDGRWVFTIKLSPNNEETYKCRYVAKGFSQVENVDYYETFSPTARIISLKLLIQIAIQNDMLIHQMDVKTAYLNANIDCDIYVQQPPGYIKKDSNRIPFVCKLNKVLYGLKQSGTMWNNLLHSFLLSIDFKQLFSDYCVYIYNENNDHVIIIIWVDDIVIAANSYKSLNYIKSCLSNKFKMKDMGVLQWFLGIEFIIESNCIKMNQRNYANKILEKFKMSECKPKSIPCDLSMNKLTQKDSTLLQDVTLYRAMVGSLIYIMTGTRPDLCYVVNKLSQNMSNPTVAHFNIAKHALRFLKFTVDYELIFTKSKEPLKIIGFCDSDWGGSESRNSISGFSFMLSEGGPLVSWNSRKQRIVALSSCEAEYVAITHAVQEAKFIRQLLADIQGGDKIPITLHVDNKSAIDLANNPVHHQRSKHIDIKYHYIRSEVASGIVNLVYVPSESNIADIFTKPASANKLNNFSCMFGKH